MSRDAKTVMEDDRQQLVEALGTNPGTSWGEAIGEVARMRAEHLRFRKALIQIVGVSTTTSEGILAADTLGRCLQFRPDDGPDDSICANCGSTAMYHPAPTC